MSEKTVRIKITGDERNLIASLTRADKKVQSFGTRTASFIGKRGLNIGRGVLGMAGGLAGGLGAYTMVKAAKNFMTFEERLVRLGIQSKKPKEQIAALKDKINNLATETGQKQGDILSGMEAIVERTGDFDFATASLDQMARVATATGSAMADIGATAANLADKAGLSADQIEEMFDIMISQGKEGAFTLQNLASMMERLTASAGRISVRGIPGMAVLGAWAQEVRKATGSPEQATTAIESSIAAILSKRDEIKKMTGGVVKRRRGRRGSRAKEEIVGGFDVIDQAATKKTGMETYKPLDEILKGIIRGTGGAESKLNAIFGAEGGRAISFMARIFRETKGFAEFDRFAMAEGSAGTVDRDFKRYMDEATQAQANMIGAEVSKLTDTALTPVMGTMAKALDGLNLWIKDLQGRGIKSQIDMNVYLKDGRVVSMVKSDKMNTKLNVKGQIVPEVKRLWDFYTQ